MDHYVHYKISVDSEGFTDPSLVRYISLFLPKEKNQKQNRNTLLTKFFVCAVVSIDRSDFLTWRSNSYSIQFNGSITSWSRYGKSYWNNTIHHNLLYCWNHGIYSRCKFCWQRNR